MEQTSTPTQPMEATAPPVHAAAGVSSFVRTKYDDLADHYVATLDGLEHEFPVPFVRRNPSNAKFVDTHVGFPFKIVTTAIGAMERSPELHGVKGFTPEEARDAMQIIGAFDGVADYADSFAANLRFTTRWMRAQLTSGSLQVYSMAKTLRRAPEAAEMIAHVDNIKRDLNRKGGRRKKQDEQPGTQTGGAPAPSGSTPPPVN